MKTELFICYLDNVIRELIITSSDYTNLKGNREIILEFSNYLEKLEK